MEQNKIQNNFYLTFLIVALIILIPLGIFYVFFFSKDDASDTFEQVETSASASNFNNNIKPRIIKENLANFPKLYSVKQHFEIENASNEYKELFDIINLYVKISSENSSFSISEIEGQLRKLLSFGMNSDFNTKERAYALNLFNLLYLQGSYQEPFILVTKEQEFFSKKFDTHLKYINGFKKKNQTVTNGIMFNYGSVESNYAVQMTMADINAYSYDLYPHIYPLLRQSLNANQATSLLLFNYVLEKNYSLEEFAKSKYYDNYIEYFEPKIEKIRKEGRFYEDLAYSSYEPLIMYSEFLWIKYRRTDNSKLAEKKKILDEIKLLSYELLRVSEIYNGSNLLFYGNIMSATNKIRLIDQKVYSAEENEKLLKEAEDTILQLIIKNKNKQMDYWVKNMSKVIAPYSALNRLAEKNSQVAKYLESVRGK